MGVQATKPRARFEVTADGDGLVGHVGAALLVGLADRLGLPAELDRWVGQGQPGRARHRAGKVVTDLAVMLADGGDCLSDLAALRDQPGLFGQVGKAVPTIGEHDRQVGHHLADPVPSPLWLPSAHPAVQLGRQPKPVGQLNQQRRPSVPDQPVAISGDFEPCPRLGSLHRQGALLDWDCDLHTAAFSQLNEGTFASPPRPLRALTKTPG